MSKRIESTPDPAETTLTVDASVTYVAEVPYNETVERWFRETFHNRQLDPDEINRLTAAKERLVALLAADAKG